MHQWILNFSNQKEQKHPQNDGLNDNYHGLYCWYFAQLKVDHLAHISVGNQIAKLGDIRAVHLCYCLIWAKKLSKVQVIAVNWCNFI